MVYFPPITLLYYKGSVLYEEMFVVNIKIAQTMQNRWNFIAGKSSGVLKKWQTLAILLWSWRGLPEPRNLETPCWMTNDSEVYWLGLGNWVNQVPFRDESPVTCNAFWDWFKKTVLFFLLISFIHKLSHNELLYWLRIRVEKYCFCVFWSLSLNMSLGNYFSVLLF